MGLPHGPAVRFLDVYSKAPESAIGRLCHLWEGDRTDGCHVKPISQMRKDKRHTFSCVNSGFYMWRESGSRMLWIKEGDEQKD